MRNFFPGELKDDPLAEAARNVNALADEHGLEKAVELVGLEVDKMLYVSEQRGLRVLAAQDDAGPLNPTIPTPMFLSPVQQLALVSLTAAYMDGIAIGWEARRLAEEDRMTFTDARWAAIGLVRRSLEAIAADPRNSLPVQVKAELERNVDLLKEIEDDGVNADDSRAQ